MKIVLSAQLLEVKTLKDKTLKLTFNTQEPSGEEAAELIRQVMEQVYIVIVEEGEVDAI